MIGPERVSAKIMPRTVFVDGKNWACTEVLYTVLEADDTVTHALTRHWYTLANNPYNEKLEVEGYLKRRRPGFYREH